MGELTSRVVVALVLLPVVAICVLFGIGEVSPDDEERW